MSKRKKNKRVSTSSLDETPQAVCFSVRNPMEMLKKSGLPRKQYFSSFEAARSFINDQLENLRDTNFSIDFSKVETKIDRVPRFLWGVYIDEAPQGFNGGIDGIDFD